MESIQKAAWIEKQLHQVTLGNLTSIACPYCGANFAPGADKLCCGPMGDATAAFLYCMEAEDFDKWGHLAADPSEPQLNADILMPDKGANSVQ